MDIQQIRPALMAWYEKNSRSLPWRSLHPDPYHVLVSECMLQQTQVSRVQQKFPEFLAEFPDIKSLAEADNARIIRAWQGMGYNNRALRLRDCARHIVDRHQGAMPMEYDELLALPGIGPYTAAAILAFAAGRDIAVVDVNIERVYSRLYQPMETTASRLPKNILMDIANTIYPPGSASAWHQAVMDLGAQICTAHDPECKACPLAIYCASANTMLPEKKSARPEPSYKNIPRRIWRGRCVQALRDVPEHGIPAEQLGSIMFGKDMNHYDLEWLNEHIVPALIKDKIAEYAENGSVRLCKD